MKLLLLNLVTDVNDPILGFTTKWINALAKKVEHIDVITMKSGVIEVDENVTVYSVGKEKGYSEFRRFFEFYRILFVLLKNNRYNGCFSHMMPLFSVMAGVFLKLCRVKLVTWYAHRQLTTRLKMAHYISNKMVSTNVLSYPYRKGKLEPLGQGIDSCFFRKISYIQNRLIIVGRISPLKRIEVLVEAMALLHKKCVGIVSLDIIGYTGSADTNYLNSLKEQVDELSLNDVVSFKGALVGDELIHCYESATYQVNCSPVDHSIDKTILESMAGGTPCLSSVKSVCPTYGQYSGTLFFDGSPKDLADKLEVALSIGENEYRKMAVSLQNNVKELHHLNTLAQKIVSCFE